MSDELDVADDEKDQQPDEALTTEVVEPFWFSELLVNKPGAHPQAQPRPMIDQSFPHAAAHCPSVSHPAPPLPAWPTATAPADLVRGGAAPQSLSWAHRCSSPSSGSR
jgi:hypothetical protein